MTKKFLIHIPKNSGMTIRHAVKNGPLKGKVQIATRDTHKLGHADAVKKVMDSNGDHHGWEHARYRDIDPKYYDTHKFFAMIRNPWDRVVSRYFFAKKVIEVEKKTPKSYADISSFDAFLEERFQWGDKEYMWHRAVRGWYPAYDHVCDDNGVVRCDILRVENLNEDVCAYFGIGKMSRARNVTAINKKSYTEIYNDKTRQIVAEWYVKDIEYWGFDFDTGATRNYWRLNNDI
jgi:hypothetical protein